jgi:RHS repeat-associated protein
VVQKTRSGQTFFPATDHLGSQRIVTDMSGSVGQCTDYYPFGEEMTCPSNGTVGDVFCFTGQQHDFETNLDYFMARHYSSAQGRFMSPDPAGNSVANPANPQTWNMYSYVTNNPLSMIDPIGMIDCSSYLTWGEPSHYGTITDGIVPIIEPTDVASGDNCGATFDLWQLEALGQGFHPPEIGLRITSFGVLDTPITLVPPQSPCTNATLAAAGVNAQEQIAMAQGLIAAGKAGADASQFSNPAFEFFGGMFGYYEAVRTGGPNDIKNQPGPGYHNQTGVDAGNISFGITCPYGAGFCQFAAGLFQTLTGHPNFSGTLATGFDTPSDNATIQEGQAMRAAGCHE